MQVGLPVIATDTKGQLEVAQNSGSGVVVIPHNSPTALASALDELIEDSKPRAMLGEASSQAFQQTFSWPICESRLSSLFGTLR